MKPSETPRRYPRSTPHALILAICLALTACGASSVALPTTPTATVQVCTVPANGTTAFTSVDDTYKVTVPKGWIASCFDAAPFSNGIRAVAPDGLYTVYILPARPTKVPAGSNGLQLFVQNEGLAFLSDQLKPDSITPCCADVVTFAGVSGVDVEYNLTTSGVATDAEFLTVAHDDSPFIILGILPSAASGPENDQLHSMIFTSFTFL